MLCLLPVEADEHHQRKYWEMEMVERNLDPKAEERSLVMQAVKLQIKMTSFQRRRRAFSFEAKVCLWEPGSAKL